MALSGLFSARAGGDGTEDFGTTAPLSHSFLFACDLGARTGMLWVLQANIAYQPLKARIGAQGVETGFDRQHD